MKLHLYIC